MLFKITLKQETHLMKMKEGQKFTDLHEYIQKAFKKLPQKYCYVYLDEDGDEINLDNQHDLLSLTQSGTMKVTIIIKQKEDGPFNQRPQGQQSIPEEKCEKKQKFEEKIELSEMKEDKTLKKQIEKEPKEQKKIQIPMKEQKKPEVDEGLQKMKHNFVHQNIKCDMCQVQTIIGLRYKCSVCDDFDLCQQCQKVYDHDHALIKIKFAGQKYGKQPYTALQIIGTTVYSGAQVLKKGFNKTVKTIRKISGLEERAQPLEKPKKIQDNVMVAIDKIKPLEKQEEIKVQKRQLTQEQKKIKCAQYLSDILGIDFSRCYRFVLKHPGLTKQELIVQYFNNFKEI